MSWKDKVAEVQKINEKFAARVAALRADKTLSDFGRRELILTEHETASEAVRKLREEVEAAIKAERVELQRKAFGAPISLIATPTERLAIEANYRSAIDSASKADSPDEARRLLERSQLLGDTMLARAVGFVGFEHGWNGIVDLAVEKGALDAKVIAELHQHTQLDDPRSQLQRRMALTGPSRPQEIDTVMPNPSLS